MKAIQDVQAANEIIHSTGEAALKQAIKAGQQQQQGFAAMMDRRTCRRCCSRSSKPLVRRKRDLQSFVMTEAIQSRRCVNGCLRRFGESMCHKHTQATLLKERLARDGNLVQYNTAPSHGSWGFWRLFKNSASLGVPKYCHIFVESCDL